MAPPSLRLVDIAVNLADRAFNRDRAAVIERAVAAGVDRMIATGSDLPTSVASVELSNDHAARVFATAGIHPHSAASCTTGVLEQIRELAERPQVVAIGECGLDYNRNFSPPTAQRRWFEAQVELATELDLPLFVHDREATSDVVGVLARHRDRLAGAVVHCFTGSQQDLDAYLELDLHIGITGWICDERRGTHLVDLVRRIPNNRLLLETDAPYLVPRTMRPRPKKGRNEPAFLPWVARAIAAAQQRPVEEVAAATAHTAELFFRLPPPARARSQRPPSAAGPATSEDNTET